MFRTRFLRSAAIALGIYGVLGLLIGLAMLIVGVSTFNSIGALSSALERERGALVVSIRTAAGTLGDAAAATTEFQNSIDTARSAANQASGLANDSAGTFRDMGVQLKGLSLFGIQPLASLAPQFDRSADQLQSLAISLGSTREALGHNTSDLSKVSGQLRLLRTQLEDVATSLSAPGVMGLDTRTLLPFQLAVYGMCLLVIMQSVLSIVAGVVLSRLAHALGDEALFPHVTRRAPPDTTAADAASTSLTVSR